MANTTKTDKLITFTGLDEAKLYASAKPLIYDKELNGFYINIKDWFEENKTRLIYGEIRLYLTDSEGNKFYSSQKDHKDPLNGLSSLSLKDPLKKGVYEFELQLRDNSCDLFTIESGQITI